MKKKMLMVVLILLAFCFLTACDKKVNNSYNLKDDYESLNGVKGYRRVNISDNNPYEKVDAGYIVDMINNKETFYVYFGFSACPWCRSVIEKSIEVALDNNVDKIYYVDVLNIRDKLIYQDGKIETSKKGTDEYYELLELISNVLSDYELYDENDNLVETNEKRIYAPNFVYVNNGRAIKLVEGISSKQNDPTMELSDDILVDEENIFDEFFE